MRADRFVHLRLARWYLVAIGSIAMALLIIFAISIGKERVDTGWFTGALLNESKENSKDSSARISAFQIAPANNSAARDLAVPFRTVFPNLALYLPEGATKETKAAVRLQMVLLGGSGLLMACLLCLIFVLQARISKDLRISQLRADFLGGVSHELRTPLTLILLYTETLLSDPDLPAEDRRKSCEVISREGQRLSHLISNLLHLSRLKRTAQDYRIAAGDLAAVVRKTSAVCSEWLGLHGFTVRTDLAASLPQVRFDPERVSEALMNIVDNARKYSGESRMVDIRLWGEAGRVILEVQDYGIGVPPNEQARIFEQFYRASNAIAQSGSGLGLFLASDVMRAHNGSIELESEIMRGSRIRMVFPASGSFSEARIGSTDHSAIPALHSRSWSQVPLARIGFDSTAAHGSTRKFGARIS